MHWIPDVDDVKQIHEHLVKLFKDQDDPISPPGIKSQDLLESACSRPLTSIGKTEKYTTLERKAAALFHSLTKNHAFHNGNKRTAVVTLLTMLHRNDRLVAMNVSDDALYDFVVAVTSDSFPVVDHDFSADQVVEQVAQWIKDNTQTNKISFSTMKTPEFLKKCEMAGAQVKRSDGSVIISFKNHSVRIRQSTGKLNGSVVKTYLRRLGLNETSTGITLPEFEHGATQEREQIYRFMLTLKRLAKT